LNKAIGVRRFPPLLSIRDWGPGVFEVATAGVLQLTIGFPPADLTMMKSRSQVVVTLADRLKSKTICEYQIGDIGQCGQLKL